MSITITITIPGSVPRLTGAPAAGPRPVPDGGSPAPTRAEQVWHVVSPYVPVLLAGAETLVPGLGVVVALAGVVGLRATAGDDRPGQGDARSTTASEPASRTALRSEPARSASTW